MESSDNCTKPMDRFLCPRDTFANLHRPCSSMKKTLATNHTPNGTDRAWIAGAGSWLTEGMECHRKGEVTRIQNKKQPGL